MLYLFVEHLYVENLKNINGISFFYHDLKYTSPWFIDCIAKNRDQLFNFLKQNGVGSRPMYPPINTQLAYSVPGEHLVSNFIGKEGLWLPSYSQLENTQIEKSCELIKSFYN